MERTSRCFFFCNNKFDFYIFLSYILSTKCIGGAPVSTDVRVRWLHVGVKAP